MHVFNQKWSLLCIFYASASLLTHNSARIADTAFSLKILIFSICVLLPFHFSEFGF